MSAAIQRGADSPLSSTAAGRQALRWLAAGLVGLPWVYRLPWDTNRVAVLSFLPALWFGRTLISRSIADFWTTGWNTRGPLIAFAVSTAIATAGSAHMPASIIMAASWCLVGGVAFLARQLLREEPETTRWLMGAMAVSGAIGTIMHWLRWQLGQDMLTSFYVYLRLMGLHALSSALASVAMVSWSREQPLVRRVGWLFVGVVTWGGLLWTGSRSPLIGIAAALAVWCVVSDWPGRKRLAASAVTLGVGGLLLSLCFWTPSRGVGWWHVWERSVLTPTQDTKAVTSNRSEFWAGATDHVKSSPWFGHGPDAYGFLTPPLEGAQPHNVALQVLLDVGLIGTAAVLALLLLIAWRVWKSAHAPGRSVPPEWPALAAGSLAAAQLDGYFFYPLAVIPALAAIGACAAAIGAGVEVRVVEKPAVGARVLWAAGGIISASLLMFHSWLFHQVVRRAPPPSPDALVARAWRIFPSVTYNIDLWVDAWEKTFPDVALATSRLACRNAQTPDYFRVKTALLLARRGDHRQAVAELELAREEAGPGRNERVESLLRQARAAAGP